jgi:hypothetical protein
MANWTKAITDPLDAASDIAKGMLDLRDTVKLGSLVIKLNAEIIAAQRGTLTASKSEAQMAEEIGTLKAEIARFETWDSDKQRYELKLHGEDGSGGALAYALKEGVQPPEHPHSICPDCYEQRKRSILQTEHYDGGRAIALVCQACYWRGFTWGNATTGTGRRRG